MKIRAIQKVEDCFDGSTIEVYFFDAVWTEGRIFALNELGTLDYYPDFPRPFFRLRAPNQLQVKGVLGEDNCRVIFPRKDQDVVRKSFEDVVIRESKLESEKEGTDSPMEPIP